MEINHINICTVNQSPPREQQSNPTDALVNAQMNVVVFGAPFSSASVRTRYFLHVIDLDAIFLQPQRTEGVYLCQG